MALSESKNAHQKGGLPASYGVREGGQCGNKDCFVVVPMCMLCCWCILINLHTNGCRCPVPLTFSNLRWWCFPFQQLAQTLYLHLWWLPSVTCTGGLFPSTTRTYTVCTYCNLHCVVVVIHDIIVSLKSQLKAVFYLDDGP